MNYLIDTHILLWLALSPNKVPKGMLQILESPENRVFVSTVSFLEIVIKQSVGKLNLGGLEVDDLTKMCIEQDMQIIQLPIEAIKAYKSLPLTENHKDPFDRALISLCIAKNYTLLSVDEKFKQYQKEGLNLRTN